MGRHITRNTTNWVIATVLFSANTTMTFQTDLWAAPLTLATVPLFLTTPVKPNVLVILDNSQSMDATMAGKLIAGDDPATRSNIGRSVINSTITNFRSSFNWGLMTYAVNSPALQNTYAYFLGSDTGMVFTDACSGTPLVTAGGKRCIVNPQPFSPGGAYVTYDTSGDDPAINDVLYTGNGALSGCASTTINGLTYCTSLWGVSPTPTSGTNYSIFAQHKTSAGNSWAGTSFTGCPFGPCFPSTVAFTETDAGFLPSTSTTPSITRQVYVPRAWGYYGNITGAGALVEPVLPDSTAHYNTLMAKIASETKTGSGEIKNGALFTPLPGTLNSARTYFAGATSPIQYTCQKNFVMMITDGLATGTTSGGLYTLAQRASGVPTQDTVSAITPLRTTALTKAPNGTYDIQTYVVGLGETVANASAVTAMNQMASAGGTGSAYLATNQTAFTDAITAIANDITSKVGSGSAVSLNTGTLSTNSVVYQARFSSGDWSGQLLAFPIKADGTLGTSLWDAGQVINSQNFNSGRTILTIKPSTGKGVAFRWPADPFSPSAAELDLAQSAALSLNATGMFDGNGAARLDYVRGSAANEATGLNFRSRPVNKLGDIVDSSPYYVGVPAFNYPDSFAAAPYSAFRTANVSRRPMIYVGANDGMLHGFDAGNGQEFLAYVPNKVFANLSKLTAVNYNHRYYVDGSPTAGDAFFGGSWHTVLVGALRGGGQGVYALDVTNPTLFTEPNADKVVLWEFTDSNDADLGYTFSQPSIVKMANGQWVAVFGNGYNNTDADGAQSATGYAALYIVDLKTGALVRKITTKAGTTTTPNGLSTPTPVDVNGDNVVDYIYAGDLQGNLWKFDVTSSDPTAWGVAFGSASVPAPLFIAKDSSGNLQPITQRVEVGINKQGGVLVYFGTGQYITISDNSTTSAHTFYGIWDKGATVTSRSSLLQQTVTGTASASGGTYRLTSNNGNAATMYVAPSTYKGWYIDLPNSGERQVSDPVLNGGRIIFTTLIPSLTACSFGGSGWLMELDPTTGNQPATPAFDSDNNGSINALDIIASGVQTKAIASTPGIVQLPAFSIIRAGSDGGTTQRKYMSESDATIGNVLENAASIQSQRVMWRQFK